MAGEGAMRPALVLHADWSSEPRKRWMAGATAEGPGYHAYVPEPVGDTSSLVQRAREWAGPGAALLGFDFPIGLPARYAERAGIADFIELLPRLGEGEWREFYDVAHTPDQISLRRPFYPQRSTVKGGTLPRHLVDALGVGSMRDLLRRCELAHADRQAASPMFWTLGGAQVGKAAIRGWREVLVPALRRRGAGVSVWPFDGPLPALIEPGAVVLAESYPGEYYSHLGIGFQNATLGRRGSKRNQEDRRANAAGLLAWAESAGVTLTPGLAAEIGDGFGSGRDGEDRFDAVVGLFAFLNVALGHRPPGEPDDERTRMVEGWILGQSPGA